MGELPSSSQSADPSASTEAKHLYQAALGDYQRGKFDLAAQGFHAYLEQAPRGDVADTAQYYLGESLYSIKDYRNAIAEFERLVRDFPQSPQVPSALLKTGYAYYEIKDGVQGRRTLRTLVEKYPTSKEAKLGEERLRLEDRAGTKRSTTPAR
jgi:tol-pal system protein YbgF